jgi:hypothetical protein
MKEKVIQVLPASFVEVYYISLYYICVYLFMSQIRDLRIVYLNIGEGKKQAKITDMFAKGKTSNNSQDSSR